MATNVLATAPQTSSPLAGIVGLNGSDLEQIAEEKGGDFLSLMLASLDEKDEKSSKNSLLTSLLGDETLEEIGGLELLKLDESLEGLKLEEATFVQILQFLEHLNGGESVKTLPKLDDKLNLLLKDASIFEEFKNAKSLKDVMALSKKYDLGLDKISITKQDAMALKQTFPKLEEKGFFKELQTSISSQDILKNSKKQITQTPIKEAKEQKPTQTLNSILQTISKGKKSEEKADKLPRVHGKVEQKSVKSDEKTIPNEIEIKEDKKTVSQEIKKEIKTIKTDDKLPKNTSHVKGEDTVKESIKEAQKPQNSDKIISQTVPLKEQVAQKDETRVLKTTQSQENKTVNLQESNNASQSENRSENGEQKQESNHQSFTKEVGKADSLHVKSSNLRHTLNNFAQEFKEKIEEYKPPIMKVKMALNPRALGEMDVTIVNRGNNLQVTITSNTSAMNLFLQNQAEFKNSLVNMGFTNLEMNFSDQRQNEHHTKNGTGFASHSDEDEDYEEYATEDTVLEMVIPDYA